MSKELADAVNSMFNCLDDREQYKAKWPDTIEETDFRRPFNDVVIELMRLGLLRTIPGTPYVKEVK